MISRGGAALLFNYLANMILGVVVPIRDRSCSFIKSSIVSLSVPSDAAWKSCGCREMFIKMHTPLCAHNNDSPTTLPAEQLKSNQHLSDDAVRHRAFCITF
jgi:hypothetical protein